MKLAKFVEIDLYSWTRRVFDTHSLAEYKNRRKWGMTVEQEVEKRISQQDTTAIDEPLDIDKSWKIKVPSQFAIKFDQNWVHKVAMEMGATMARSDKDREFLVMPGRNKEEIRLFQDRVIEEAVRRVHGILDFKLIHWNLSERHLKMHFGAVRNELEVSDKAWFQSACATRKTSVLMALLEHYRSRDPRFVDVVVVPGNIELANQFADVLATHTILGRGETELFQIIVHSGSRKGLSDVLRFQVVPNVLTVDPNEIAVAIKEAPQAWKVVIVVSNSIEVAAEGIYEAGAGVNSKAIDELHRTACVGNTVHAKALYLECERQFGGTASQRNIRM